jgi:deoxyribose-phosphate aldolase
VDGDHEERYHHDASGLRRTLVNAQQLAARIDHTLLKPEVTATDIVRLCQEAREYGFATVCVNPTRVSLARQELEGSTVSVCSVVGFPLGANISATKARETELAILDGAVEIDMVLNIGLLKDGSKDAAAKDVAEVRRRAEGLVLKVIIEAAILTDTEIEAASRICVDAGADFVKTSTGFNQAGGATVEQVRRIRSVIGDHAHIKAAGGIRTLADALALIAAGADRLGASAGISILSELDVEVASPSQ